MLAAPINHQLTERKKMIGTDFTALTNKMTATIENRARERAKERAENAQKEQKATALSAPAPSVEVPVKPDKAVVLLPEWFDDVRGVPNSILRSSIFGIATKNKGGQSYYPDDTPKPAPANMTVLQAGYYLDQADLDTYLHALHLAHSIDSYRMEFSSGEFLRGIGRNDSGPNIKWLLESFERLTKAWMKIRDGKSVFMGCLMSSARRVEKTHVYTISLNSDIAQLFSFGGWTQIEWKMRIALRQKRLALWLYGMYMSHAAPFPLSVDTLYRWCGSEAKELSEFRRTLKGAFDDLCAVTKWTWLLDKDDLVYVTKPPSPSQARHLARKEEAKVEALKNQPPPPAHTPAALEREFKKLSNVAGKPPVTTELPKFQWNGFSS